MNLGDYRQAYYEHSGKASDVARTLALSGLAVIWIFAVEKDGHQTLPTSLLWPGALIVTCLALDLLQYVIAAAIWGGFARHHEKKRVSADRELVAPAWFNWPALACFWGKLATVMAAYGFLLTHLLRTLFS